MGITKPPIGITGIWLLREGDDAVVMAEVDGEWRRVIVERLDGWFSHIVEQFAIQNAPVKHFATKDADQ